MIDNIIAARILSMLVTPFDETDAFKLGLIDENGKLLKSPSSSEEKRAYNMLDRLVFNLKRILVKLPGGDSKLKNLSAAYFLVRENYNNPAISEWKLISMMEDILDKGTLVEETIEVKRFLEDAPANATGAAVSTDEPVIKNPRKKKKKSDPMRVIIP